jgi:hypothetical protein
MCETLPNKEYSLSIGLTFNTLIASQNLWYLSFLLKDIIFRFDSGTLKRLEGLYKCFPKFNIRQAITAEEITIHPINCMFNYDNQKEGNVLFPATTMQGVSGTYQSVYKFIKNVYSKTLSKFMSISENKPTQQIQVFHPINMFKLFLPGFYFPSLVTLSGAPIPINFVPYEAPSLTDFSSAPLKLLNNPNEYQNWKDPMQQKPIKKINYLFGMLQYIPQTLFKITNSEIFYYFKTSDKKTVVALNYNEIYIIDLVQNSFTSYQHSTTTTSFQKDKIFITDSENITKEFILQSSADAERFFLMCWSIRLYN